MSKNTHRPNRIVCIHGIATRSPQPELLEKAWEDAIIQSVGADLDRDCIDFVYWGDVAERWGQQVAGKFPELQKREKELKEEVIQDAVTSGLNEGKSPKEKKGWTSYASRRKNAMTLFQVLDTPVRSAMLSLAKDSLLYFHAPGCGEEIRARLECVLEAAAGSSITLIAHSLGTVISYEVLRKRESDLEIQTFITLGSPLGLGFVYPRLLEKKRRVPDNIRNNWSNFADPRDFVATDRQLSDDYKKSGKRFIRDFLVENMSMNEQGGRDSHNSIGYLLTPRVGEAIRDALGLA
jgi:hypothetical protein